MVTQGGTIYYNERYAFRISFLAKAGEQQKCDARGHLKSRLTGADIEWWTSFIAKEREKRETWEEMTEEEYLEAGESFDISALSFKSSPSDQDDGEDEDIFRAEAAILRQLNKEHRPVRYIREMQTRYVVKNLTDSAGR